MIRKDGQVNSDLLFSTIRRPADKRISILLKNLLTVYMVCKLIQRGLRHSEKFQLVTGIRADHNNLYGWFATPRLNARYEPVKGTTIRLSSGRGQRTANIFAENMSVLASSRDIHVLSSSTGKAYGLDPEVA